MFAPFDTGVVSIEAFFIAGCSAVIAMAQPTFFWLSARPNTSPMTSLASVSGGPPNGGALAGPCLGAGTQRCGIKAWKVDNR
jgi:hypothetical protein